MAGPQVWIGCLAAYNEGMLHGRWTDATDVDTIEEAGAAVIKSSPAQFPEELFIADYDEFPREAVSALGEYPSYEAVARIGALLEEHGDSFAAYLSIVDDVLADDIESRFEDALCGQVESEKAYAYEYVADCGWAGLAGEEIPDSLYAYLDWDSIADELFKHGTLALVDGYVFETNA